MRKDKQMEHVTKNGYRYYTPQGAAPAPASLPKENKWKDRLKWMGAMLLAGLKSLPGLLMRAASVMVATPIMILLFIINLIKCLIATAIGWFVFKVVVGFAVICYWAFFTKEGAPPASVETWFYNWLMPAGVPIHHWWETTIIVTLSILTALSLTLHPSDE